MRTKNTLKNIVMNILYNILNYGLRFVSRIIFVKKLSVTYLGINGLLSNVLGLLSLTELGLGSAIGFSLYKPLADKDEEKIKSIMRFYQKTYRVIFVIVSLLGIALLPGLPFFIKDSSGIENLNIIYLIFLFNMVISYLFSYKRTLITADQKNYKIVPITIGMNILTTTLQIIVLLLFENYYIYLIVQSICIIIEHLLVNKYINKEYPYLLTLKSAKKIDEKELKNIKINVKSLMLHKIGTYITFSTDNLVISKYIGIISVGIYSNYCLIINMLSSFIQTITGNAIAGFGNLIASENAKKRLRVFKEMDFICYLLYGLTSVCLINLLTPFIGYSFGDKFILSSGIMYVIVLNYYIIGLTSAPNMIQSASGLYRNDRYAPLIQSIVNIIFSILLVKKIGLIGVFIGTTICMIIPLIVKPIIIYKHVFDDNVIKYFLNLLKELFAVIISVILSLIVTSSFSIPFFIGDFIIKGIISAAIFLLILILFYHNSEAYKDVILRVKKLVKKKKEA